jgi:hypothetical protein
VSTSTTDAGLFITLRASLPGGDIWSSTAPATVLSPSSKAACGKIARFEQVVDSSKANKAL